jgi:hypothetical protein
MSLVQVDAFTARREFHRRESPIEIGSLSRLQADQIRDCAKALHCGTLTTPMIADVGATALEDSRQQHRDPSPVAPIFIAEDCDQIALLQGNADQDIGRGNCREQ